MAEIVPRVWAIVKPISVLACEALHDKRKINGQSSEWNARRHSCQQGNTLDMDGII
jgi:hypothetical protein